MGAPSKQGVLNRAKIIAEMHGLVGITEVPDGSNGGTRVHQLQSATHAYNAPWCVSTVQYAWLQAFGHTLAEDTANAYFFRSYCEQQGWVVKAPVPGGPVVYQIGAGHMGVVVSVNPNGSFEAIEGNEGNAVRQMVRDPRTLGCTFIEPPALR